MRVPIAVGLVLATVALLTACGSVAAPVATRPRVHPGGTRLAARGGPAAGSRAEAVTLARLMLSRLRLPAGARRLPSAPCRRRCAVHPCGVAPPTSLICTRFTSCGSRWTRSLRS
jgi:hypothetical protein